MKIILYIFLFTGMLATIRFCSLSRKLLYFPVSISTSRLAHIKNNFNHIKEVTIPAKDNNKLHGWIIEKDFKNYPTIIYFGGNAEEVSFNIEDFNNKLQANFILVNYRGYGLSEGAPSEKNLLSDAEEIYDYLLKNIHPYTKHIFVMGRSLGSGIAVHLAVKKNLMKTILITPYDSIENVAISHFPKFLVKLFLTDTFKTTAICSQLKNDVSFIIAENDQIIAPRLAKNLYDNIKSNKEFIMIKNADHNNISTFSEYWKILNEILKN